MPTDSLQCLTFWFDTPLPRDRRLWRGSLSEEGFPRAGGPSERSIPLVMPGGPFKPTTFQQNVPEYAQIQEDVESASNPAERHARHRDESGPSPACSNRFRDWLSQGVLNSRSFDCSRVEETGEIIPYNVMQIPDHERCSTGRRRRFPRERTACKFRGFQKGGGHCRYGTPGPVPVEP